MRVLLINFLVEVGNNLFSLLCYPHSNLVSAIFWRSPSTLSLDMLHYVQGWNIPGVKFFRTWKSRRTFVCSQDTSTQAVTTNCLSLLDTSICQHPFAYTMKVMHNSTVNIRLTGCCTTICLKESQILALICNFKAWFIALTHKHAHPVTYRGVTVSLGNRSFVKLYIRHLLSASSSKCWGLFPCVSVPRTTGRRQETFHSATKVRWMTTRSYWHTRQRRRQP